MKFSSSRSILNFQIVAIFIAIISVKMVSSYECYVCKDQENNNGKCIKTVKTCDIAENTCMTKVRWGSTPYWDPTGQKQYYITKECATSTMCEKARHNTSRRCDRIWYNDWECVECCFGDRCNYFITLGTSSITANVFISICTTITSLTIMYLFK